MLQVGDMEEVRLLPRHQPASSSVHYTKSCIKTRSSSLEDWRNYPPKHVELIEVINKLSLLLMFIGPCIIVIVEE